MEQIGDTLGMLDLMVRPAFCVKDGVVRRVNDAAKRLLINVGAAVSELLATGQEEYAAFEGGCLYLTLFIANQNCGASVTRMDGFDIFRLEPNSEPEALQAMALAAQELRGPLTNVMASADQLFPMEALQNDPAAQEQAARLNRGLFQMLRLISNMSDATRYCADTSDRQEVQDITSILREVFQKAAELVPHTGLVLRFSNLPDPVFSLADAEKLERAVYNILSNAIKFTPAGGIIDAKLTQRGNMLYLTVQDSGSGIAESIRGSVYSRFQRTPGIEDSRHGVGLGMVLIHRTAALHGGTVLLDQPDGKGSRITMTLAIRQNTTASLRSPTFRIDYLGGRDHALLELSDSLPVQLYEIKNEN